MAQTHAVGTVALRRRPRGGPGRSPGKRMLVALALLAASVVLMAGLTPVPGSTGAVVTVGSGASAAAVQGSAGDGVAGGRAVTAVPRPGLSQVQHARAVAEFGDNRLQAIGRVAVARSVVASAQLALDSSAGHVLTEASREDLAGGIRLQALRITRATGQIDQSNRRALRASTGGPFRLEPVGLTAATTLLDGMRFGWAESLGSVRAELAGPVDAVQADVAAWHAEQARLAAVEAARVAAEAARAQAAAAAAPPRASAPRRSVATAPTAPRAQAGPAAGAAAPALFNKLVWTSGFQSEIDACRGAVDVTGNYGVATIAEHWQCGGSRFPGSGRTITLSGVRSGTYLVGGVVAVLNANTQGTASIPRGHDLLYQTCINGSNATMSFTVLTRIG